MTDDVATALLEAARRVPIAIHHTAAPFIGFECVGCGACCGMYVSGRELSEDCKPGCWVAQLEEAMQAATLSRGCPNDGGDDCTRSPAWP